MRNLSNQAAELDFAILLIIPLLAALVATYDQCLGFASVIGRMAETCMED